jgi:hypothetical protein
MGILDLLPLAVTIISGISAIIIYVMRKEIKVENASFKDWVREEFSKQDKDRKESSRRQYEECNKLEDRVRILESAFKLDSQMFGQTLGFLKEQFAEYKKSLSEITTQIEHVRLMIAELRFKKQDREEG